MFSYKFGLISLPPIAKVMENRNFKHVYLITMILRLQTYFKNQEDLAHGQHELAYTVEAA